MHRAPVIYRRRFFRRRSRRFSWENRSRSACLLFRANIPQGVSLLRTESGSVARVTGGGRNVVSSVKHEVPPAGVPSSGSDRPFRVHVRGGRRPARSGAGRGEPSGAGCRGCAPVRTTGLRRRAVPRGDEGARTVFFCAAERFFSFFCRNSCPFSGSGKAFA